MQEKFLMNFPDILDKCIDLDLDNMIHLVDKSIVKSLDTCAPKKTIKLKCKKKKNWYDDSLILQKREVRKCERIWIKIWKDSGTLGCTKISHKII